MKRQEVLMRFCNLSSLVAAKEYNWELLANCICSESLARDESYQFDEQIMEFIERAVKDRLNSVVKIKK